MECRGKWGASGGGRNAYYDGAEIPASRVRGRLGVGGWLGGGGRGSPMKQRARRRVPRERPNCIGALPPSADPHPEGPRPSRDTIPNRTPHPDPTSPSRLPIPLPPFPSSYSLYFVILILPPSLTAFLLSHHHHHHHLHRPLFLPCPFSSTSYSYSAPFQAGNV